MFLQTLLQILYGSELRALVPN